MPQSTSNLNSVAVRLVAVGAAALALFAVVPRFGADTDERSLASGPATAFSRLLAGDGLEGWELSDGAADVFTLDNGELTIRGSEVPTDEFIVTRSEHGDYHLRFEYKWGDVAGTDDAETSVSSGIVHRAVVDGDGGLGGFETQTQAAETGDLVPLGGASATADWDAATSSYLAGADPEAIADRIGARDDDLAGDGWNTIEVIVRDDTSTHLVNGTVVSRAVDQIIGGDPAAGGRIAIRAQGADVSYRNVEIKALDAEPMPSILVFAPDSESEHPSAGAAVDMLERLGAEHGFGIARTDDPGEFEDVGLAGYDAVAFVSTSGDLLDLDERHAFEHYIRGGGNYFGLQVDSGETDWEWFGLVAGTSVERDAAIIDPTITVLNRRHPSTAHLGASWISTEQWEDYDAVEPVGAEVLLSMSIEDSDGSVAVAWLSEVEGGRTWSTAVGRTRDAFDDPDVVRHLLGGVEFVLGRHEDPPVVEADAPRAPLPAPSPTLATITVPPSTTTTTTTVPPTTTTTTTVPPTTTTTDAPTPVTTETVAAPAPVAAPTPAAPATVAPTTAAPTTAPTTAAPSTTVPGANNFLNRSGWTFSTSVTDDDRDAADPDADLGRLNDGSMDTRWTSGTDQRPGMYIQIDLGRTTNFGRVKVQTDPATSEFDFARGWALYASDDPNDFGQPLATGVGELVNQILVPDTTARHIRLVQTGSSPDRWWSISEIFVIGY